MAISARLCGSPRFSAGSLGPACRARVQCRTQRTEWGTAQLGAQNMLKIIKQAPSFSPRFSRTFGRFCGHLNTMRRIKLIYRAGLRGQFEILWSSESWGPRVRR